MQEFIISLFAFLLVIFIMVFIHEWGHFVVARLCGVKVDTFAIGFGKTIWSKTDSKGTEWKINILPLGGYVKMFGDAGPASDTDIDKINKMTEDEKSLSFFHKKLWQKALVVFAGPFMNYVLAFLVMFGLIFSYGVKTISTKVAGVEQGSPAEKSGVIVGDVITSVNDKKVNDMFEVRSIVNSQRDNRELRVTLNRNDSEKNISIMPVKKTMQNGESILRIGVVGSEEVIHYGIIESIQNAAIKIYVLNAFMVDGLFKMLSGKGSKDDIGGPIKIAKITGEAAKGGMQTFLSLLVLLSLNLGLLNLLPIPGLDGGHLMYYLINTVIGRPIPHRVQTLGIKIGFMLLISLMLFVTINDILSL